MATTALKPGLNQSKQGVDLRSRSVSNALRFLLFGKHPEQTRRVGSFHELRVVKERPSVRLGELILVALYRFLFAKGNKMCTSSAGSISSASAFPGTTHPARV
jgi:hypothetical protein